ncbi:MAG: tetratricopeptide repeat-containing glycosyltransferase family protein [Tepidisphaeraceae bacterium]|jgi:tetratricopeptide (TPR) repeat protein
MSETIEQIFARSQAKHLAGNFREAEVGYRQILAAQPNHADSIHMLGVLAHQTGQQQIALDLILRAISINDLSAQYFSNLSLVLSSLGRNQEALAALKRALALKPDDAVSLTNLANTLIDLGQYTEATTAARRLIQLYPKFHLGYFNLGNAERLLDHLEESAKAYETAIELKPNYTECMTNLANVYFTLQKLDQAFAVWDRIFDIPNYPMARLNRSIAFLLRGDYQRGFEEYESRLLVPESGTVPPDLGRPRWNGEPLHGQRILLYAEQAFGDTFNFARYIPMVAERGGKIILCCHPASMELLKNIPGVDRVTSMMQPLPEFDLHCPLPSLPWVFQTRLDSIPAEIPYIHADPAKIEFWKSRLAGENRRKIGLAWAGRPIPRNRFVPPQLLAPLANVANVRFYSLQKSDASATTEKPPLEMVDWTEELKDFSDTAGLIANLDLILTVDTAVAHLAGAMGKPTWIMLKFVPDWRWMLGRSDSLWYPTARLFRQERLNDWQSPVDEIVAALNLL